MNEPNTKVTRQRDLMLVVGTIGLAVGLTLMLLSIFITIKTSKLMLLALLVLSSSLFYQGLHSSIRRRIEQNLRFHFRDIWRAAHGLSRRIIKHMVPAS
ncbi:MAG: hypothetical protein V2I33_10760 [Kangiellaceae bacterium]|jgi:hypothetical protein|nr:hypothetical protein [Kangiellaceae bacterium]